MSFEPGWSFDNYFDTGTFQPSQTVAFHRAPNGPPRPVQAGPSQFSLARAPPFQTGPHLVPTGPFHYYQTCPPQVVLTESPHSFQSGPHYLFQPQPQPLQPLQTPSPPFFQNVTHNVFLTEFFHPRRTGAPNSQASLNNFPPLQRVTPDTTSLTSPSPSSSQLLIMDSVTSSPEKQTSQQTHADLLQAFQSYKPARRGPSKTPQPPSTSRTQRSATPVINASQATRGGFLIEDQRSPSTTPSTQETVTRKRSRKTPYMEYDEEPMSSGSDTPLSQTLKRPRQSPSTKTSSEKPADASTSKQATTIPKHVVEVQIQNGLARMEDIASRTIQHVDSSIQREQSRASMTPEVAATSIEGIQGQQMNGSVQYQNPAALFVPQTVQSSKTFATKLLNENQKLAESLSQKNGTFLRSVPSTAKSYLEGKLAQATAEATRLHQEKVDAIRLEFIAELQRDMDERQKVIDMLLQKPDA